MNDKTLLLINKYVVKYYNDIPDITYQNVYKALKKEGIIESKELDEAVRDAFNEFTQAII
jgi:hypothetical protein|tara:strand:+ start:10 stop:189 length:180 start_codon:yes stop_codon:yes gene_type:complete